MRLVSRIPADRGHVRRVTVRVQYDGEPGSDAVDITDVQLQPGEPSGVVPHPSDVAIRAGGKQYRNGVITRSTDEVIILANLDRATPTRVEVTPGATGAVRVGSMRFGRISSAAWADASTGTASRGWGRPPVLTERSDGRVAVDIDRPVHMTVEWDDRS